MSKKSTQPYRLIDEQLYDSIIKAPQNRTVARISFFKKIHQKDFAGILYLEIDAYETPGEIEKIFAGVRKTSFLGSLSYRQDISMPISDNPDKQEEKL